MPYPIHQLRPDESGLRMHYLGDAAQKAYRGHLTQTPAGWVAWATYGPAAQPDRQRALIGDFPTRAQARLALNIRLNAKLAKGYRVPAHVITLPGQERGTLPLAAGQALPETFPALAPTAWQID